MELAEDVCLAQEVQLAHLLVQLQLVERLPHEGLGFTLLGELALLVHLPLEGGVPDSDGVEALERGEAALHEGVSRHGAVDDVSDNATVVEDHHGALFLAVEPGVGPVLHLLLLRRINKRLIIIQEMGSHHSFEFNSGAGGPS